MTLTRNEVASVWSKFKVSREGKHRDTLIEHYSYLVKITSGRVVTSLPPNLERDDLISVGVVGLIKAVDQFDPGRQVKFETYAIALIRGAMLEMLREEDWVPRSIRDNVKNLERTYHALEVRFGRPATEHEVAAELNLTIDDLQHMLSNCSRASVLSLEDALAGGGGDSSENLQLSDVLQDEHANVMTAVELIERKRMLGLGIDRLPEREKLVIALYYYEGLTFKEIGAVLLVSESRVYQLHTQAVLRLRGYLQRDAPLFQAAR
jgi:RNA polymerase sigma factor for flagellar operon FliA